MTSGIRTEFEFVLPRGYLDESGALHKRGVMRLATARDELQPLRDPTITSPDDPRLTILVLARVVQRLGTLDLVTPYEIEGLFAADLAYLQVFYGIINFGTATRRSISCSAPSRRSSRRAAAVTGGGRTDDRCPAEAAPRRGPNGARPTGGDRGGAEQPTMIRVSHPARVVAGGGLPRLSPALGPR